MCEGGGRDMVAVRKGRRWDADLCKGGACDMVAVREVGGWDAE